MIYRSIKRIIFETVRKHDGKSVKTLSIPDIKQIGGRAGRYKTAFQMERVEANPQAADGKTEAVNDSLLAPPADEPQHMKPTRVETGLVTTLEKEDLPTVLNAMGSDAPPLTAAGLLPPAHIVQRFCNYFPVGTPFSYMLLRLHEIARVGSRFFICDLKDITSIADAIQDVKELSLEARLTICQAPVGVRDPLMQRWIKVLAECIARGTGGSLLELEEIELELLDEEVAGERSYLQRLERLHKQLVTYLWLSFRFMGVFTTRSLAMHVKEMVEKNIEQSLSQFNFSEAFRKRQRQYEREQELLTALSQETALKEQNEGAQGDDSDVNDLSDSGEQMALPRDAFANEFDRERSEEVQWEDKREPFGTLESDQFDHPAPARWDNGDDTFGNEAEIDRDDAIGPDERAQSTHRVVEDVQAKQMSVLNGAEATAHTTDQHIAEQGSRQSPSEGPFNPSLTIPFQSLQPTSSANLSQLIAKQPPRTPRSV